MTRKKRRWSGERTLGNPVGGKRRANGHHMQRIHRWTVAKRPFRCDICRIEGAMRIHSVEGDIFLCQKCYRHYLDD